MSIRLLLAINNLDTAGMKHVLAAIVRRIDTARFSPVVVVNKKTDSSLERELSALAPVEELMLRSEGLGRVLFGSGEKIKRLRSAGVLIHDFDYSSDWTGAWLAKRAGIPYIAEKTNLSIGSWRWWLKLGLAKHIVCLSSAQRTLLARYNSKLTVVPTGVDISRFASAEPMQRKSLGLKDDDTVLVSVAHPVPVKGYEELIEAVAQVAGKYPRLRIVAVGKGDPGYLSHLFQFSEAKQVRDRFIFTGPSDNIPGLLRMADGKILATQNKGRREAFGAALVEAMAAGLPVIATRSGGPEDIVEDGITGFLVDGLGAAALADGIDSFMQARSRWKEMGRHGYERACKFYREEDMVRAYETVYDGVLHIAPGVRTGLKTGMQQ
jgi:glycosyltransferase involved in cell wall biosynthesis